MISLQLQAEWLLVYAWCLYRGISWFSSN